MPYGLRSSKACIASHPRALSHAMIPRMSFQESLAALHRDRRNVAIFDIAATFILLGGVITILAVYPGPWMYAFAFIAIGLMQYRIVIACHEAAHKTLLFPLWLNELVGS